MIFQYLMIFQYVTIFRCGGNMELVYLFDTVCNRQTVTNLGTVCAVMGRPSVHNVRAKATDTPCLSLH